MNLDKTIKGLTDRLDTVYPAFSSSNKIKHDGIIYWKGKQIICTKDWNELYEKSSTYTNAYTIILISRKPLLYFPNDFNGLISISGIIDDKLKEEIQNWNKDYYELLEYRKNPTFGKQKCSKCLLSGSNDDPIFIGIEKVFARIVSNQCNDNGAANNHSDGVITYHCNIMNIFLCPFESKENNSSNLENNKESKYPYKREDLFALQRVAFAIEQAISTFFEITKNNEIIYEVDFEKDRIQEIHTKYNREPESWGWKYNVRDELSKVKPISNIKIREEKDIYDILTNREKLECLLQESEKKNHHQLEKGEQQVCCDENTPCVPPDYEKVDNSNEKMMIVNSRNEYDDNDSHKVENRHSKKIEGEVDNENLKPNLKLKIKEELEKSYREQLMLLKENKQNIIDFIIDNKNLIRVEDLKIYEPIYKCYRQKSDCHICNTLGNIVCINCNSHNYKEVWLCTNHWQQHAIDKHE